MLLSTRIALWRIGQVTFLPNRAMNGPRAYNNQCIWVWASTCVEAARIFWRRRCVIIARCRNKHWTQTANVQTNVELIQWKVYTIHNSLSVVENSRSLLHSWTHSKLRTEHWLLLQIHENSYIMNAFKSTPELDTLVQWMRQQTQVQMRGTYAICKSKSPSMSISPSSAMFRER